jgi:ubiquinone/menaquinone biosynthesis C-methylase UbiE
MPSLEENQLFWGKSYDWDAAGNEWSATWGGAEMQWFGTILPRIHQHLPTSAILEIAPGFGRWTHFLADLCDHMTVVDISEKCISACRERFRERSHIDYHINDGKSLSFVENASIDFVFSFDSLVHAEEDVIEAYLNELGRILKPGGAGFIHHSNLGEFGTFFSTYSRVARHPRLHAVVQKMGVLGVPHWRAPSMTATKFSDHARKAGLVCTSQEKINWGGRRTIDCLSSFKKGAPSRTSEPTIIHNPHFMSEAGYLSKLSRIYGSSARAS